MVNDAQDNLTDKLLVMADATRDLNEASDDLNKSIEAINARLKSISPGVSAWLPLAKSEQQELFIGYTKIGDTWQIALRQTQGARETAGFKENVWSFTSAARWMRIDSAHRIPDLIDTLNERVRDMTVKMRKKADFARELADAIRIITP